MITIICPCGEAISTTPIGAKRKRYCSKKCFYKYRPKTGFKKGHPAFEGAEKGWFKKEMIPWNKGKKGIMTAWNKGLKGTHFSPKTEFKKDQKSWNKNKEFKQIQWDKHPNFKGGKASYVKFIKRKGFKPICSICKKEEKEFSRKMIIHHQDKNKNNNSLNNLKILCSMCHVHLHKNWEKRWKDKNIVAF